MIKQNLFLLLMVCCFFACNKPSDQGLIQEIEATPVVLKKGVHNLDDFQALVDQDLYPINQLSKEAVQHFKEGLTFQEGLGIRSANSEMVNKELDQEGQTALWELLLEQEVTFFDDIAEMEAMAQSRGVRVPGGYLLNHHRPIFCHVDASPIDCCGWSVHQTCRVPYVTSGN